MNVEMRRSLEVIRGAIEKKRVGAEQPVGFLFTPLVASIAIELQKLNVSAV